MAGPLTGVRVVELAGLGPAPYGVMLLADLGADVVRVDRAPSDPADLGRLMAGCWRGRRSVAVNLKHDAGLQILLDLADGADVLVEGFRPGVAERLGFGPQVCLTRNPRLVYARMTGWGQDGPLSTAAGHDLNFLAVAGLLHGMGRADAPPPPLPGYVGDFGGGGAFLAIGVLAALLDRRRTGLGQVVDASVLDGAASLGSFVYGLTGLGEWTDEREANLSDGGCPFYDTYQTADGGFVAVGALEPRFYVEMLHGVGLDPAEWPQHDRTRWPALRSALTARFATSTRDEWARRFAGRDACVSPVLRLAEAPHHPHNVARGVFEEAAGRWQPAPAPRLSRTPLSAGRPAPRVGEHTAEVLVELGRTADDVARLRSIGTVEEN
ncbi:CaiB/BaiF CoA transferase family protein [Micromonospora chalcea]|uniref:CaiB/BaiF CoA transferase family protein n=1 Tax=Micromonospora chalcea TaxID=1874 RepID=UPI0033F8E499